MYGNTTNTNRIVEWNNKVKKAFWISLLLCISSGLLIAYHWAVSIHLNTFQIIFCILFGMSTGILFGLSLKKDFLSFERGKENIDKEYMERSYDINFKKNKASIVYLILPIAILIVSNYTELSTYDLGIFFVMPIVLGAASYMLFSLKRELNYMKKSKTH